MTELLRKAFEAASSLPPEEQDALAKHLLEELASEQEWASAFDSATDALERLADEAVEEHRSGKSEPLDPDRL